MTDPSIATTSMSPITTGRYNSVLMGDVTVTVNDLFKVSFIPTDHLIADLIISPKGGGVKEVMMLMSVDTQATIAGDETKNTFCLIDAKLCRSRIDLLATAIDRRVGMSDLLMILNQIDGMSLDDAVILRNSTATTRVGIFMDVMSFMGKARRRE